MEENMDINEPLDQEMEVPVRPGDEVPMDVQEPIAAVVQMEARSVVPNIVAQNGSIGVALGEPNIDDYNGPSGIARGASNIVEVRGPNDIVLGVPIRGSNIVAMDVQKPIAAVVEMDAPGQHVLPVNAGAMQAPPAPAQMTCPFLNCVQRFDNDRQLLVHAFNNHQPIQYPCPVADCLQSFRSMDSLFRHLEQVRVAMESEQDPEQRARMHQLYQGESVCIKCNQAIRSDEANSNERFSLRQLDRICDHKQTHRECLKQNCRVADGGSFLELLVHNTYVHGPPMVQLVAAVAAAANDEGNADGEDAGNDPVPAIVPRQGPSGVRPPGHRHSNPSPSFSIGQASSSGDSGYDGSPRGNRPPNPNNSRVGEPPAKRQREQKKE